MPKIRWFEVDAPDSATPIDWRWAALTTAVLFLNLFFWYAHSVDLWMSSSLPIYATLIATAAVLVAALFFVGPALAIHRAGKPLFEVFTQSFGSIPGLALRVCCGVFLVVWISSFLWFPGRWLLWQAVSPINVGIIAGFILLFLFFTGLPSLRTTATLAVFSALQSSSPPFCASTRDGRRPGVAVPVWHDKPSAPNCGMAFHCSLMMSLRCPCWLPASDIASKQRGRSSRLL